MTEPNTTALIEIEKINAAELFVEDQKPLDTLLDKIKSLTAGQVPDLETLKGRDEIAALAYRVTRSKTALDKAGMALNAERAKQTKIVNAARKRVVTFCDTLRDEIRQPLTDWEAEKATQAAEEERLAKIVLDHVDALEMNDLVDRQKANELREKELEAKEAALKAREDALKAAEPDPEPEPEDHRPAGPHGIQVGGFPSMTTPVPEKEPVYDVADDVPDDVPPEAQPYDNATTATRMPERDNAGFIQLRGALRVDHEYALSWHRNLSISFYDAMEAHDMEEPEITAIAADGATRFMKLAFNVDTSA